ncbi:zinc-ribbon domain-containing protein [Natroniella sp. ANB-PHB2]|uniref:DUF2628 domain-containing protein n=1 Tax=Natroniella sp. ANB-PHB2 TaxID=3384444 RepID=UPI0038D4349F
MYCSNCGIQVGTSANFCSSCGQSMNKKVDAEIVADNSDNMMIRETFQEKGLNQQKRVEGWNWWAFLFGALWYFYKGMVGKGIAIFIGAFIIGSIIPFLGVVPVWIYCGAKGNEDYQEHINNLNN